MSAKITIKVRGYHIDLFGHVNNARYLEFLEEARWSFFEESGGAIAFARLNLNFVVVNINISYRHPAVMGDVLRIESGMQSIGRSSAVMKQTVKLAQNDTVVVDAKVTFVFLDPDSGRVRPIAGEAHKLLQRLAAENGAGKADLESRDR